MYVVQLVASAVNVCGCSVDDAADKHLVVNAM